MHQPTRTPDGYTAARRRRPAAAAAAVALLCLAAALVGIALLWWRLPRTPATAQPNAAAMAAPAVSASTSNPGAAMDLPPSLQGTQPDGGVRFDARGQLVTDAELRRLLDWYLAAIGEQDIATIRARLQRDMAARMTPAQAATVMALFDRYVAYQQASTALPDTADLRERLAAVHALRVRLLGADAARGFFGEEETEAQRVLSLRAAAIDASLSASERAALQATLDASSPGYAQARTDAALRAQVQQLDAQLASEGASAAERHAERSALLGSDAADRFEQLDAQRAAWQSRAAAYRSAREALATQQGLTPAQRSAAQARLLEGFSAPERRRIEALIEAGAL